MAFRRLFPQALEAPLLLAGARTPRSRPRKESAHGWAFPLPPARCCCLFPPPAGNFPGAVVELEGRRGRMRIELKGVATAELVALSRALWDGEA